MVPRVVIADDLTGACEIAGLGYRFGLRATVCLDPAPPPLAGELLVFDTETRLAEPPQAAERVAHFAHLVGRQTSVFKKIDSVLRGPITAELFALAHTLGRPRIWVAPANPGLGRCVIGGRYLINGVPLDQTTFAHDPHHPAQSADVATLLGSFGSSPTTIADASDKLPSSGLVIANTASEADLNAWAKRIDASVLPAGAAALFAALLVHGRPPTTPSRSPAFSMEGPILVLSGTTVPAQRALADQIGRESLDHGNLRDHQIEDWSARIIEHLHHTGRAAATIEGERSSDITLPPRISGAFGQLTRRLLADPTVPPHLVIEGGSTAAAVASAMGWRRFDVRHEWSQGVVTLAPVEKPAILITVKPGSYPWAPPFTRRLFAPLAQPISP